VFNSFFRIESLEGMTHPSSTVAKAQNPGIFENNDPTQRLIVVINFNNDIGDCIIARSLRTEFTCVAP